MDVSCGYGNPKNTGVQWRSGLYTEVVWSEDERMMMFQQKLLLECRQMAPQPAQ